MKVEVHTEIPAPTPPPPVTRTVTLTMTLEEAQNLRFVVGKNHTIAKAAYEGSAYMRGDITQDSLDATLSGIYAVLRGEGI